MAADLFRRRAAARRAPEARTAASRRAIAARARGLRGVVVERARVAAPGASASAARRRRVVEGARGEVGRVAVAAVEHRRRGEVARAPRRSSRATGARRARSSAAAAAPSPARARRRSRSACPRRRPSTGTPRRGGAAARGINSAEDAAKGDGARARVLRPCANRGAPPATTPRGARRAERSRGRARVLLDLGARRRAGGPGGARARLPRVLRRLELAAERPHFTGYRRRDVTFVGRRRLARSARAAPRRVAAAAAALRRPPRSRVLRGRRATAAPSRGGPTRIVPAVFGLGPRTCSTREDIPRVVGLVGRRAGGEPFRRSPSDAQARTPAPGRFLAAACVVRARARSAPRRHRGRGRRRRRRRRARVRRIDGRRSGARQVSRRLGQVRALRPGSTNASAVGGVPEDAGVRARAGDRATRPPTRRPPGAAIASALGIAGRAPDELGRTPGDPARSARAKAARRTSATAARVDRGGRVMAESRRLARGLRQRVARRCSRAADARSEIARLVLPLRRRAATTGSRLPAHPPSGSPGPASNAARRTWRRRAHCASDGRISGARALVLAATRARGSRRRSRSHRRVR